VVWRDRLQDGGFETGMADYTDDARAGTPAAVIERLANVDVKRNGTYGVLVETGQNGGVFALRAKIDKGEMTRYTLWARSLGGPTDVQASVLGVKEYRVPDAQTLDDPVSVHLAEEWTEVQFAFPTTTGLEFALFVINLRPNTRIAIDDARIEAEHWREPRIAGATREVGGIEVPAKPIAPIHFNVLMHIEDPKELLRSSEYFWEKTAVFSELARILHEHGGFLTIQPEEDWPQAAARFAGGNTLAELARDYGVAYSTHTHGPKCLGCIVMQGDDRVAQGACSEERRPLSNVDCGECRDCETITTDTDPYTPVYVGNLRALLEEASGTTVSDHNGNWKYENLSALADVGIRTLSAFKQAETQSTFDVLFTNPWRPTHASAVDDPSTFFLHDPSTQVIFVPGWGQAITRHPEFVHERLAAMLAQVISRADADRVNTFYIVTHVGHFEPESDDDYIVVDPKTGEASYGDAFLRDLAYWEETLTQLVEPLVEEGYIQWTSLPEIGELFVEWEADCANR